MKSVCVGDNVIDYYVNSGKMFPGGNSLNVAVHLAKLGVFSAYLGNIALDRMGEVIIEALKAGNVHYEECGFIAEATTKHCNYNVIDGERTFISVELGENWQGPMVLTEKNLEYLRGFDVVISNCNAKMPEEMAKISALDKIYVYDFGEKEKYRTDEYLETVCRNLDLAMFSFAETPEEEIKDFAEKVQAKGCANVLVTMGSHGQYLCNCDGLIHGQVQYVEAVDTMGAGDSFLAAFICETFRQGWKKGEILSPEKVKRALKAASEYSRDNCLVEGGFGYEVNK